MRPSRPARGALLASLALAALLSTACGQLTIRTWVKVVEAESSGIVTVSDDPYPFEKIQGGFLAVVRVDTSKPTPIHGTMALDDIRLAASEPDFLQKVCVWGDPTKISSGTLTIDLTGGESSADIVIHLLATTQFSQGLGLAPIAMSQPASFDLGGEEGGVGALGMLLKAERSGSADGMFETRAAFSGETAIFGIPVVFDLDLLVSNEGTPPSFDGALLDFCGGHFEEQGRSLFWSVNSKASYLTTERGDKLTAPLVIDLADAGIAPGDRVRLRSVGSFADERALEDGTLRGLTGVFSASAVVTDPLERRRVRDARDAGTNVVTPPVTRCILGVLCPAYASDIPEDFRIDPSVDVRVPGGATHLVIAALPPRLWYRDNSAFGFGVSVENRGP